MKIKRGLIVLLVFGILMVLLMFFYFSKYSNEIEPQENPANVSENISKGDNSEIDNITDFHLGELKLSFSVNSPRNPNEIVFVDEDYEENEEKITGYIESINKSRTDLKELIKNSINSDIKIEFESDEEGIGLTPNSFPILKDSGIKSLSLAYIFEGESISFTPSIRYENLTKGLIEGTKFSLNVDEKKEIWKVGLTWEANNSNNEDPIGNNVKNITFYDNLDVEKDFRRYDAFIKAELGGITKEDNISKSSIRFFSEVDFEEINDSIIVNKEELFEGIEDERQIIIIDAEWIVKHLDKSCKGIKFPGVSDIGVAEYSSSKLKKALSDEDYTKKEGVSCPLKEVENEDPKITLILND